MLKIKLITMKVINFCKICSKELYLCRRFENGFVRPVYNNNYI